MTWDVPVANNCPQCGQTMFKISGRGSRKPFCINEKCKLFLPEDKRGYKRKPKDADDNTDAGKKTTDGDTSVNKPVKKKASPRKSTTGKSKPKKKTTVKTTTRGKTGAGQ